jgi:hypothetical protein
VTEPNYQAVRRWRFSKPQWIIAALVARQRHVSSWLSLSGGPDWIADDIEEARRPTTASSGRRCVPPLIIPLR